MYSLSFYITSDHSSDTSIERDREREIEIPGRQVDKETERQRNREIKKYIERQRQGDTERQ